MHEVSVLRTQLERIPWMRLRDGHRRTCHPIPDAGAEGLVEEEGLDRGGPLPHTFLEVVQVGHGEDRVEAERRDRRLGEGRRAQADAAEPAGVEERDLGRFFAGCGVVALEMQDELEALCLSAVFGQT